jgi:serine protease Do
VLPSIVSISSTTTQTYNTFFQEYSEDVEGSGSGFIIGKDDSQLFIVTNYHVVEGTNELTVGFIDDTQVEATVKGYDSDADLAVVTVKLDALKEGTIDKIAMATIGDSNKIKAGDTAIAIGNALGYGQSVTVGCISATSREIEIENKTMTLIQTDAAINPGNSGGALLNSNGEVIGINTIKFIDSTVEGMGYSIPISDAIPIVENLISAETLSNNEQGYLGIQGNDVTEEYSVNFDMPIGVYIAIVADDSPAQTSGLCAGDIITKVNDLDIKGMERLQNVISSTKVGTEVTVTVQRKDSSGKYKEVQVKVTLGNRAESEKNK